MYYSLKIVYQFIDTFHDICSIRVDCIVYNKEVRFNMTNFTEKCNKTFTITTFIGFQLIIVQIQVQHFYSSQTWLNADTSYYFTYTFQEICKIRFDDSRTLIY